MIRIVTSPHRVCKNNIANKQYIRDCDVVSGLAADLLTSNINGIGIIGNEYRANHDLNRNHTRDTNYRKVLRKILETYKNNAILLDVHSFPNYYFDTAGEINFFKKHEDAPDIVIMKGPNDDLLGKSFSYELFSLLKKKYHVKIISGINVLDILNETAEYNIPGVLLEFNEKYINDIKGLKTLCIIISQYINTISNNNNKKYDNN
jgi:hypothetical protein